MNFIVKVIAAVAVRRPLSNSNRDQVIRSGLTHLNDRPVKWFHLYVLDLTDSDDGALLAEWPTAWAHDWCNWTNNCTQHIYLGGTQRRGVLNWWLPNQLADLFNLLGNGIPGAAAAITKAPARKMPLKAHLEKLPVVLSRSSTTTLRHWCLCT